MLYYIQQKINEQVEGSLTLQLVLFLKILERFIEEAKIIQK